MKKDKKLLEYEGKSIDYRRFSYIVLMISIFLFFGLIIPGEQQFSIWVILAIFVAFILAFIFNKKAVYYKRLLEEEE